VRERRHSLEDTASSGAAGIANFRVASTAADLAIDAGRTSATASGLPCPRVAALARLPPPYQHCDWAYDVKSLMPSEPSDIRSWLPAETAVPKNEESKNEEWSYA
jgi:hypothetical protein